jgi:hypothetical protein
MNVRNSPIFAIVFLLSLTFSQETLAQVDSLSELFPLEIGDRWTYSYIDSTSGYLYFAVESGTAVCEVVSMVFGVDMIWWRILLARDYKVTQWVHGGPPVNYSGKDSTYFVIIEQLSGRHELSDPNAGNYASDVWPIWSLASDFSVPVTKYGVTDSTGIVSIARSTATGCLHRDVTFQKNCGITQSSGSILGCSASLQEWHCTMTDFRRFFAALSVSTIDLGSIIIGTQVQTEIILTNRMGVPQEVMRMPLQAGGPVSAREPFSASLAPYASLQDTLQFSDMRPGRRSEHVRYVFSRGGTVTTMDSVLLTAYVLPATYALLQNYPNPFNPTTVVRYQLPVVNDVRLAVYDILGREVSLLVNERKDAGVYEVKFDASRLSSGVYLYRLQAGDFTQAQKMMVLR